MKKLLKDIRACQVCADFLEAGCRPVVSFHPNSQIMVIGQAPGRRVHQSGIPWDDKSGENLRSWMGIDSETFYDVSKIAIVPMGFCYPGTGKSGDLAPRKECAPLWHGPIWEKLRDIKLTLLIGKYAQNYYLKKKQQKNLTQTVQRFQSYLPQFLPLPHPSPRNNIWMKKNPWFKTDVLPFLKEEVQNCLG